MKQQTSDLLSEQSQQPERSRIREATKLPRIWTKEWNKYANPSSPSITKQYSDITLSDTNEGGDPQQ